MIGSSAESVSNVTSLTVSGRSSITSSAILLIADVLGLCAPAGHTSQKAFTWQFGRMRWRSNLTEACIAHHFSRVLRVDPSGSFSSPASTKNRSPGSSGTILYDAARCTTIHQHVTVAAMRHDAPRCTTIQYDEPRSARAPRCSTMCHDRHDVPRYDRCDTIE
jgi:hypothetical protein